MYEDSHIQVIHSPGAGKNLVITFGDMFYLANGLSFFAEIPAKKLNLSAIGFMAKTRNWYPQDSVRKAISEIADILSLSEFRVIYGGSMGGYAALKFSRLLGANRVYSLVPQFSINPQEIIDHRYNSYFDEDLNTNNAITYHDLAGEVYITHDPVFQRDHQHVSLITRLGYPITFIPLRFSIHGATTVLASTSFFEAITCKNDLVKQKLYRIFKERRRNSRSYVEGLAEYLIQKRPHIALKLLSTSINSGLIVDNARVRRTISTCLIKHHQNTGNINDFESLSALGIYKPRRNSNTSSQVLKTVHNTILAYNSITRSIIQTNMDNVKNLAFLHPFSISEPSGLLSIHDVDGTSILVTHNHEIHTITNNSEYHATNYIIYRKNKDYYTISNATKHLSAMSNGQCAFSVEHVKAWEKFYPETLSN